jgi:hypothetical protein
MKFQLPEGCVTKFLEVPDDAVLFEYSDCVPVFAAPDDSWMKRVEDDGSVTDFSLTGKYSSLCFSTKEEFAVDVMSWCSS